MGTFQTSRLQDAFITSRHFHGVLSYVTCVKLLCYFLLVIEAAFICAVLLTSSAYLVMGKSFRRLCSFCGYSVGIFRGVISPLLKFKKFKA